MIGMRTSSCFALKSDAKMQALSTRTKVRQNPSQTNAQRLHLPGGMRSTVWEPG